MYQTFVAIIFLYSFLSENKSETLTLQQHLDEFKELFDKADYFNGNDPYFM